MNETTYLYRHFAADGALLYVGISLSWPARTKAHVQGSTWFDQVARVEIEQFPTRDEALAAERDAIKSERPRFNVVHNRPRVTVRGARKRVGQKTAGRLSTGPLGYIAGPHALVGPALVYRGNTISVLVAWGTPGTPGDLTEIVLGELGPEVPDWADACASVLVMLEAGQITMAQARETRLKIVRQLASRLPKVDAFDTDLALARAFASRFPSDESRKILAEIAA